MPIEVYVILGGLGVVALAWLLLRFGKQIARAAFVAAVLAIVILGLLTFYTNAQATRQAAKAATVATTGHMVSTLIATFFFGVLSAVILGALAFGGFWWLRWKLAERRWTMLSPQKERRALPEHEERPVEVVTIDSEPVDLSGVDLSDWGW